MASHISHDCAREPIHSMSATERRLRACASHVAAAAAPAAAATAPALDAFPTAEPAPPLLLSDQQVQEFIVRGFLDIGPVDGIDHDLIYEKLEIACYDEVNPGNNVTARVPELGAVLRHPKVTGALQSVMGNNFAARQTLKSGLPLTKS